MKSWASQPVAKSFILQNELINIMKSWGSQPVAESFISSSFLTRIIDRLINKKKTINRSTSEY